ncbi:hypothetical protein AGMMS49942_28330 [Spirochaetia bacterium]|nr:hypothetical protein AGMMS49942_28330 [Spirochaetia bacterium]
MTETLVSETKVSETGKIVFDTNWVINFGKGKVGDASFLGADRHISVISRIELYGFPGISPKEREDITRFLKDDALGAFIVSTLVFALLFILK